MQRLIAAPMNGIEREREGGIKAGREGARGNYQRHADSSEAQEGTQGGRDCGICADSSTEMAGSARMPTNIKTILWLDITIAKFQ